MQPPSMKEAADRLPANVSSTKPSAKSEASHRPSGHCLEMKQRQRWKLCQTRPRRGRAIRVFPSFVPCSCSFCMSTVVEYLRVDTMDVQQAVSSIPSDMMLSNTMRSPSPRGSARRELGSQGDHNVMVTNKCKILLAVSEPVEELIDCYLRSDR